MERYTIVKTQGSARLGFVDRYRVWDAVASEYIGAYYTAYKLPGLKLGVKLLNKTALDKHTVNSV